MDAWCSSNVGFICSFGWLRRRRQKADNKAAGVKGSLMVYTSIYPDIIDNMCKPNVAKAFPDMKVNWFQGGTEKVITKITGEIKAKKLLQTF